MPRESERDDGFIGERIGIIGMQHEIADSSRRNHDFVRILVRAVAVNHAQSVADLASYCCLLYTSDAADERSSVDLGGRRIIKKKKKNRK